MSLAPSVPQRHSFKTREVCCHRVFAHSFFNSAGLEVSRDLLRFDSLILAASAAILVVQNALPQGFERMPV